MSPLDAHVPRETSTIRPSGIWPPVKVTVKVNTGPSMMLSGVVEDGGVDVVGVEIQGQGFQSSSVRPPGLRSTYQGLGFSRRFCVCSKKSCVRGLGFRVKGFWGFN